MEKDFKAQLLLYLTEFLLQGLKQGNRYYVLPHSKKEVVHFLDGVIERVAKSDLQPSSYHPLLCWSCREILKWFNRHLPPHSDTHTHICTCTPKHWVRERWFFPLDLSWVAESLRETLGHWNLLGTEAGTRTISEKVQRAWTGRHHKEATMGANLIKGRRKGSVPPWLVVKRCSVFRLKPF